MKRNTDQVKAKPIIVYLTDTYAMYPSRDFLSKYIEIFSLFLYLLFFFNSSATEVRHED